jgi:hypothetical protein
MDISDDNSLNNHDPDLNATLQEMQGENSFNNKTNPTPSTDDNQNNPALRSPVKNKPKKRGVSIIHNKKTSQNSSETYKHEFSQTIITTSIKLKEANPFNEFIVALQSFLTNAQLVDPKFAFCPIDENNGDKKIHKHSGIPINMTMLSTNFSISQNSRNPFNKQKVWGENALKNKEEVKDPVVYFSMAIAMDVPPKQVMELISFKWNKSGGRRIIIKELQSFDSKIILALFNMYTGTNKKMIMAELRSILYQAIQQIRDGDKDDPLATIQKLPPMDLRLQVPKLPGQDVSNFNKLSYKQQASRKVLHVECDKQHAETIKTLIQYVKEALIVDGVNTPTLARWSEETPAQAR